MELDRDPLAGRLLDGDDDQVVEQRLRLDPDPTVAPALLVDLGERRRGGRLVDVLELQPGAVGDDRLQADDPAPAELRRGRRDRHRGTRRSRRDSDDQALDHRLEPEDLLDPARGQAAELVEAERRVGAVARVDQPGLEVAALDDLAGQPLEPALATRRVDGVGRRLAVEQRRPARGSSIGRTSECGTSSRAISGKYDSVRWIRNAVVVRRLVAQQRVAVVVDDRDRREVEGHRCARIST